MVARELLHNLLDDCLLDARFDAWSNCYERGKVRDIYRLPDRRILITTDRQSAFDHVLGAIPLKGQVLNRIAQYWFEATADIVPNHVLDVPHANVTVGAELTMFPVEIVVRGYLTGSTSTSVWTHYDQGVRKFSGNALPDGMVKNEPFAQPILTPTTKSHAHDVPIAPAEIVERGLVDDDTWQQLEAVAFALYQRGVQRAAERGLILVDTKYEIGRDASGRITVADEVHTPDSSRYWIADTYEARLAAGQEPENLDKEFLRLWLKERGISDDHIPELDDDIRVEVAQRYIDTYERITGQAFEPDLGDAPLRERIERAITPCFP